MVTSGGLIGKVIKIKDNIVTIEIAPGVNVEIIKTTIANVIDKDQPLGTQS